MSHFIIELHFRPQEWIAEEKWYLAAKGLDAKHFGLGIAAIPCGTAAFFLCHGLTPFRRSLH